MNNYILYLIILNTIITILYLLLPKEDSITYSVFIIVIIWLDVLVLLK